MTTMSIAERLAAVRSEMARLDIDAFVLQRTDQHNSEYLPESEGRVAWLTGFTGSHALAVVTRDAATVLSDGRYTVQLAEEVDADLFDIRHIVKEPAKDWLKQHLQAGQRLGLDPYLTKAREHKAYASLALDAQAEVVLLAANPVDTVWQSHDRPDAPLGRVEPLGLRYTGTQSAAKCLEMGKAVVERGADCLLVTAADEIAWLLNVRGSDIPFNPLCLSHLLLASDGRIEWFVTPGKLPNDLEFGPTVRVSSPERLMPALAELGEQQKSVLLDPNSVHIAFSEALKTAGARVVERDSPIPLAKAIKNAVELQGARDAQARDAIAMVRFLAWLDTIALDGSESELSAAARLSSERQRLDLFRGASFDTISAHGPNAALPHYRVSEHSNRPLTGGTLYLVDSGGQYLDGTTDITRTIALGTPSDEMRERFTLVLKGHIAIARAQFPKGTHGGQIDILARQALWDHGLDFDHGTGHGIGAYLCVHEGPQRIAKAASGTALRPGMIVSNEPGYYKADNYGIRIENLITVEPRQIDCADAGTFLGFETITFAPIDKRLIDPALLGPDELTWLNDYHTQVFDRVAPQLDDTTRKWLRAACQPI